MKMHTDFAFRLFLTLAQSEAIRAAADMEHDAASLGEGTPTLDDSIMIHEMWECIATMPMPGLEVAIA